MPREDEMSTWSRVMGILAVICWLAAVEALGAGGSPVRPPDEPGTKGDPAAEAIERYNAGLAARDRAWKLEAKAVDAASEADREKLRSKARKHYEDALGDFQAAVAKNPRFHQAFGSLGYSLRKTGQYDAALTAYDRALEIEPSYSEAIEYRAEAHVEMGRTEEAKEAYVVLFGQDRTRANMLLAMMKNWVTAHPDPALAAWIADREEIAGQVASLADLKERKW
jgi:tetratricopeptide (TPR) repeat protein